MRLSVSALVALVVLVLVPVATAAPEGFRESRLTPKMRAISGNPQAVVYCAVDLAAFKAKLAAAVGPQASAIAFTTPSENAAYFRTSTCLTLENWLRGKPVTRYGMGSAAHTFAHEAVHMRGQPDERAAECGSLRTLATTLRVHFGVKNKAAVREMVAHAKDVNQRRSAVWCGL